MTPSPSAKKSFELISSYAREFPRVSSAQSAPYAPYAPYAPAARLRPGLEAALPSAGGAALAGGHLCRARGAAYGRLRPAAAHPLHGGGGGAGGAGRGAGGEGGKVSGRRPALPGRAPHHRADAQEPHRAGARGRDFEARAGSNLRRHPGPGANQGRTGRRARPFGDSAPAQRHAPARRDRDAPQPAARGPHRQ